MQGWLFQHEYDFLACMAGLSCFVCLALIMACFADVLPDMQGWLFSMSMISWLSWQGWAALYACLGSFAWQG
jgi:hypothetical protein